MRNPTDLSASSKSYFLGEDEHGVPVSRASLTVRITVKSGDPPGAGKIWENQFFTGKADFHGANCSQIGTYTCQGTRKSGQNFFHLHIHGRRSHFSGGHLWFLKECTKLVKLDFSSSRFIFVTTSISHIPPSLLLHSKALSVNACRIMVQKKRGLDQNLVRFVVFSVQFQFCWSFVCLY